MNRAKAQPRLQSTARSSVRDWKDASSVSVVIAARDAGETLGNTLDSITRQTVLPHEIIVVDDGSTEPLEPTARRFGAACIRIEPTGLPGARNAGAKAATGDLLSFADADDLFTPNHLEISVETIRKQEAATVATDAWYWVAGRVTPFTHFDCSQPPNPVTLDALMSGNPLLATCTIPRDVFLDIAGYDEELAGCSDYDLWLRLAAQNHLIVTAPKATMYYRRDLGMSADAQEMYSDLAEVLARFRERQGGFDHWTPAERHAAVGAGNWALLGGDPDRARREWSRARSMGDKRLSLYALSATTSVVPPLARAILRRRLTAAGRPLPRQLADWWRDSGHGQPVVSRPDLSSA